MIVLSGTYSFRRANEYFQWLLVDQVIQRNMTSEMKSALQQSGYKGLFQLVPVHFGITRMYRDNKGVITYEFTPEQWTLFALRWL